MDFFNIFSDSLFLGQNELKEAFWNYVSTLKEIKVYFGV